MNPPVESLQLSVSDCEEENVLKDYELIKIFDYHLKIINELEKTLLIWETYPTKDLDQHELLNAEKRANEFRSRFTRNYLYPLRTETRELTKTTNLLKCLTKAYQTAFAALLAFNAYSIGGRNLQVLDKMKEFAKDVKNLRQNSYRILEPIEITLGNDRNQLDELCQKILDIPEIINKERKRRKMVPVIVKSNLDMYEPKLTNWAKRTNKLLKKKLQRDRVIINSIQNKPNPEITPKICKKPVELDRDVETAVGAYLPNQRSESSLEAAPRIDVHPSPEKSKNVGLICVTSQEKPVEELPKENRKIERVLQISPETLQELFR